MATIKGKKRPRSIGKRINDRVNARLNDPHALRLDLHTDTLLSLIAAMGEVGKMCDGVELSISSMQDAITLIGRDARGQEHIAFVELG